MIPNFKPMKEEIKKAVGDNDFWEIFNEISQIPRKSKNEAGMIEYLSAYAGEKGFDYKVDKAGNVLINVPATNSSNDTICLQSHMDMVCEKEKGHDFDFTEDSINIIVDGEYLTADRTSAGFDNGIGVAYMLSLLDENIPHPNLELVFTTDEETGLSGAFGLEHKLEARKMINLDSEDGDEITVGCAGAGEVNGSYSFETFESKHFPFYELTLSGLEGGHSAMEIDDNKGNAIEIGMRILDALDEGTDVMFLKYIQGGTANNAIPRDFSAQFTTDGSETELNRIIREIVKKENIEGKPLEYSIDEIKPKDNYCIPNEAWDMTDSLINEVHIGKIAFSEKFGIIESSNNLGVLKVEGNKMLIEYMPRSMNEKFLNKFIEDTKKTMIKYGFEPETPFLLRSWQPNFDSELLKTVQSVSKKLHGKELHATATHGGLECGVIQSPFEGMTSVSIGPTIYSPHSPAERVNIESANKTWEFVQELMTEF